MNSPSENIADANEAGVELLLTDTKLALTFLDLAETTESAEDRSRRIGEAHHAYQTVLHFLGRVSPTAEQAQTLGQDLEILKARLRTAGVAVD